MNRLLSMVLLTLLLPSLVTGQTLDSEFSNPTNLTDQEMLNAQEFTHQGIRERALEEGCAKANNCTDSEDGLPLEKLIGQAYVLMGTLTGDGGIPKLTSKPKPAASGTEAAGTGTEAAGTGAEAGKGAKAEKEQQNDYCMMAAMAYELLGATIQNALQKKAESTATGAGDVQLQSLVSLKETHKARKKTATIQSAIYGGVTACYTAMLISGQIQPDWKFWAKFAGAGTLTTLYIRKVSKHDKAADQVQKVIDSLPKAGDCNPWTGTSCFCAEATSKTVYPVEYQEVCVLNNGNFDTPKVSLGCGAVTSENKIEYDKECKCKATNTCLKSNLKSFGAGFSLANNYMNEANKTFELLNSGTFDQGKLDAATLSSYNLAAKVKNKINPKDIPSVQLTADQKKVAAELAKTMSPGLAAYAAVTPSTYQGGIKDVPTSASAISKLTPEIKQKLAEAIKVNYKKGSGNNSNSSTDDGFVLPTMGGPAKESGGTEVVSFAEQAINKADVSNSPETPIFDIISNRYRRSGWEKLDRLEK